MEEKVTDMVQAPTHRSAKARLRTNLLLRLWSDLSRKRAVRIRVLPEVNSGRLGVYYRLYTAAFFGELHLTAHQKGKRRLSLKLGIFAEKTKGIFDFLRNL